MRLLAIPLLLSILMPIHALAELKSSRGAAVAAAHPLAAEAGEGVLREGGNALDAAIAVAFALNVVEPQASGIGGGGFLIYREAATGKTYFLDYRETAPAALTEQHFTKDGKPASSTMRIGGLSVGTPGSARGLLEAHAKFGTMPLDRLLAPAIRHAEEGFAVSELFSRQAEEKMDMLMGSEAASATYLTDGMFPLEPGTILKQPALGATLRRLAAEGDSAIYSGVGAKAIADAVQAAGGVLAVEDLANFKPRWREALMGTYRGYDIVTAAPPSSGGLQLLQILACLEAYDLKSYGLDSKEHLALYIGAAAAAQEAARKHLADPATTTIPMAELTSREWIDAARARTTLPPPNPAPPAAAKDEKSGNTSHFSVIDAQGNAVALTSTINGFFGAGVMVGSLGILLNNEMIDFDFESDSVNFPAAGKIPRSNMAPLLVMKDGELIASVGSPGGTRIPGTMAQIMVRKIDFGESLQDAINGRRIHVDTKAGKISYEKRYSAEQIEEALALLAPGAEWKTQEMGEMDAYFGGAQGCWIEPASDGTPAMGAAADPRRDGAVRLIPPAAP